MIYLDAGPKRLGERGKTGRDEHEFLNVDRVGGMSTPVENVETRHREQPRRGPPQIAEQGKTHAGSGGAGDTQGDSQNGVGAQVFLVGCAIEICQQQIDLLLAGDVLAEQRRGDRVVDVTDSVADGLAHPQVTAVTQLDGLQRAGRDPGRYEGATNPT